ncbi:hypothetical protein LTR78_010625 [Recurvomyces mirabilis]|uniref:Uncharacterized protein n=1 Tax=Recurvomyces mirabilis TaxID=574656 RepID=A0AAE0TM35_9PEZI|nr:hypothetical protein LTR78_010625 [Recurvomyces mirabilis]
MAAFSSDFVGLPIIISDYDAIVAKSPTQSTFASSAATAGDSTDQSTSALPLTSSATNTNPSTTTSSSSSVSSITQMQNWTTGFADFADAVWNRMESGVRRRLREACVEVLRRTGDPGEEERVFGGFGEKEEEWDEDARFLD